MDYASYNGHGLEIWEDVEDDNRKIFHDVFAPGDWEKDHHGRVIPLPGRRMKSLDLSPYGTWDFDLMAAVIELGFPTRKDINSIGPLNREDVERLWREKHGDKPMPKAETW